jgi:hypothetical protein
MSKAKTKTKEKKWTVKAAKAQAASMGVEVNKKYDKRFLNTWLYTIGEDVEPVERKQIVHVPKKTKKPLTMKELIALAKTN